MVVVISKEDIPPIQNTYNAIDRINAHAHEKFEKMIDDWWENVKEVAQALCRDMGAYDTGTLHDTIRIIVAGSLMGTQFFEVVVSPDDITVDRMLMAGGMLINPKTGRICDYAQAVHDGHLTKNGKFVAGRPFLTMALDLCEPELRTIMNQFMLEEEREWERS